MLYLLKHVKRLFSSELDIFFLFLLPLTLFICHQAIRLQEIAVSVLSEVVVDSN